MKMKKTFYRIEYSIADKFHHKHFHTLDEVRNYIHQLYEAWHESLTEYDVFEMTQTHIHLAVS